MLSILYPFVRQFKNAEIFRSRVRQQRIITRTGAASIPLRRFPVDPDVRFRIAKIRICAAAASADDVPNFHPNTVDFTFCRIQNRNRQVWILIRNDIFCEPRFDPQIAKTAVAAFANELRVMDHTSISIDLSQFVQKEINLICGAAFCMQRPSFAAYSLMLGIYNLLPVWPLDGGRVLRCALLARLPITQAEHISEIVSFAACAVLLLIGVFLTFFRKSGLWPLGTAAYLTVRLLMLARRTDAVQ